MSTTPSARAATDPVAAGRVALVTGASRGIGAAVARALGAQGIHVVATGRTVGGLEETDDAIRAAGGSTTLLPLDLREGTQVDMIGPTILDRFGRLDIMVHAAAVLGRLTPAPHIMPDDWRDVVEVNLASVWHLVRSTAPLLVAAEAGRAVFLTAGVARQPVAYWGAYGATKAAAAHLALTWAEETRKTRLRINLFDPGVVATRLRAQAMPGEDPRKLRTPDQVAPAIVALCGPEETRHAQVVIG